MYADIIVDISIESLDKKFQYEIPTRWEKYAGVGSGVMVPFGKGNRLIHGFIIGVTEKADFPVEKIKQIHSVDIGKVLVEAQLLQLAVWIQKQYGSTMNEALKTVLPVKKQVKSAEERWLCFMVTEEEAKEEYWECLRKNYTAKARLLAGILDEGSMTSSNAIKKYHVSFSVVQSLVKQGIIKVTSKPIPTGTDLEKEWHESEVESLNKTQQNVWNQFISDYRSGIRSTYLIHGVTGSGKTEVYIKMIQHVIQEKKQAIVLVPEIALTHQTVMRFHQKFGNRVSVLHSRMSSGERYAQYLRAKNSELDVIIGPRSALFIPMPELGVIVLDEEHEASYKNESTPKYHAREVAIQRAKQVDASVILASATPSLESYTKAKSGEYKYCEMSKRAGEATLPDIHIVDLRQEFAKRNHSIFSRKLQELIREKLNRNEQIMLFLNRRGFAGFVSCRQCGEVLTCVHCDVSYKAHRGKSGKVDSLICHYCGHKIEMPEKCPKCGSVHIAGFGIGTEQLEKLTKEMFPEAVILRMDADTTAGKGGHEEVLGKFRRGEANILIGTQMIVKGHDFPTVTLVGVMAADLSMYAGDYRSSERTFQLLMQASGRAGRGRLAGEVVIQTYQPEHHCIQAVKNQSYEKFYQKEIMYRNMLRYPPVYHMMVVLFSSKQEEEAKRISEEIAVEAKKIQILNVEIIGPVKANLSKVNDWYRHTLYIKCDTEARILELREQLETIIENRQYKKKCGIQFDKDPVNGY